MEDNIDAYQWLRTDAALLVVFVSDEDDRSWNNSKAHQYNLGQFSARNRFATAIVNQDTTISECPGTLVKPMMLEMNIWLLLITLVVWLLTYVLMTGLLVLLKLLTSSTS